MRAYILSILCFVLSCSTNHNKREIASFSESYDFVNGKIELVGDGDPIPESLKTIITEEQIEEIRQRIKDLRELAIKDVEPVAAGNPDYKLARERFQRIISSRLTAYYHSLSNIDEMVKGVFAKLYAAQLKVNENPKEALYKTLLASEIKRLIPSLNRDINSLHQGAIEDLYLTDVYPVRFSRRNHLKKKMGKRRARNIYSDCKTSGCMLKMSKDHAEWLKFVETMNKDIDFINFKSQTFLRTGLNSLTPTISIAVYDTAEELMKGPRDNVQYNLAGYLWQHIKKPAGVITAAASSVAFLAEKIGRFAVKIASLRIMKVNLKIEEVDAYSSSRFRGEVSRAITHYVEEKQIPAYLYGDQLEPYKEVSTPVVPNPKSVSRGNSRGNISVEGSGIYTCVFSKHSACVGTRSEYLVEGNDRSSARMNCEELASVMKIKFCELR